MIEKVIFKDSLYVDQFNGNLHTIDKHIEHIREFDKGVSLTNIGGYHSNNITFGFQELIDFIFNCFLKLNVKCSLSNFWLNINKGSDSNKSHVHGLLKGWSVVYYHKVCCTSSPLIFNHLVPQIITDKYCFIPQNQNIVFFRPNIPHSVEGCGNVDHERISIAFNFKEI